MDEDLYGRLRGLPAGGHWHLIGIGIGVAAAAAGLAVAGASAAAIAWQAASAAVFLALAHPRLRWLWRPLAGPLALVAVSLVVWLTGGPHSPLIGFLLLVILHEAFTQSTRRLIVISGLAAVARGLPLVYGTATRDHVAAAASDAVLWVLVGLAAHVIVQHLVRSRDRLRERDAQVAALYTEHADPGVLLDPQGRVTSVNQAFLALTGLPSDEVVGRDLGHLVDTELHAAGVEHIVAARAGLPQLYDTRIRSGAGGYRDFRVALHPLIADGQVVGLSCVGHDVTEQVQARDALARSEDRYRSLTEHARVGIYHVAVDDRGPRFDYVNPALEDMTGVPAERWFADVHLARHHIPAEDQDAVGIDATARVRALRDPATYRWRRPDGQVRWHEATEVPVRDLDGRIIGLQGIVRDVTAMVRERDAMREALDREQQAVRDLERLDEMKNTFLQSVSHELRTPLTGVVGFSRTLRDRVDQLETEQARLLTERIHHNASKLQRLLADLLDVDRLSRGAVTPDLAWNDLAEIAAVVIDDIDTAGREVVLAPQPTPLMGDGPKLERVVENLVMNAVRHTPTEATIWVRCEPVADGGRLVVEDDGPGIPDELKRQLFEPFFQGPDSGSKPNPGTGIGLSLVARLTELHAGVVRIEDRDGGGARFVVELPADGGAAQREAVQLPDPAVEATASRT